MLAAGLMAACAVVPASAAAGQTASTAKAGSGYKLALTTGGSSDAFYLSLNCGAKTEAKALGDSVKVFSLPTGGGNAQDEAMDNAALISHPAGALFGWEGSENYVPIIRQFQSRGIPVVEINSATTASNYYQAVVAPATDDTHAVQIAKMIAHNAGNSGSVIILAAAAASPTIDARWKPVVAELKKLAPGLQILPTEYDGFSTQKAESITSGLLVAHPNVKAIWTTSGPEGEGAIAAVQQAHEQGKALIYSYDAEPEEVTALKDGTVKALLAQSPFTEGEDGVKTLVSYLRAHSGHGAVKGKATPHVKSIPTMVLTKGNVSRAAAKPYLYRANCPS